MMAFAITAMVFTSCTTETIDSTISWSVNFEETTVSGQTVVPGLNADNLREIALSTAKANNYEMLFDYVIVLRAQTSEKNVKTTTEKIASEIDKAVKTAYGDPVKVQSNFNKLEISFIYTFGKVQAEVTTLKYK